MMATDLLAAIEAMKPDRIVVSPGPGNPGQRVVLPFPDS